MTSDFKLTSTRESTVEDQVIAWAVNNGWLHRLMIYRGRRGCPDSFFFGFGQIVMIEFKKPGKGLDPLQIKEHERLEKAGLSPWLVRTKDEGVRILSAAMR